MPIIASHHKWKDAAHAAELLAGWPDDCSVQWGGNGVVIGGEKGGYNTAFFEAFPAKGGFIRGEGPSIREAEAQAFIQYTRQAACAHQWCRKNYRNGGCICSRCGGFAVAMPEIRALDAWAKPISASELDTAKMGALRPNPADKPREVKWRRRTALRIARCGIVMPNPDDYADSAFHDLQSPYALACRDAVFGYIEKLGGPDEIARRRTDGAMDAFFSGMGSMFLSRDYEAWRQERARPDEHSDGIAP